MKKNQQEATEIQETSKVTVEEAFVQLTEIVEQMENQYFELCNEEKESWST